MDYGLTVAIVLADKNWKKKQQKIKENEYNLSEIEDSLSSINYSDVCSMNYDKAIRRIQSYAHKLKTINMMENQNGTK